jgi:hypothetical protein
VIRGNLDVMYNLDKRQQELIAEYARTLRDKVSALVGKAMDNRTPVRLAWGTGQATFAANRRNNKESDAARLRADGQLKGPVDLEVPVLAVTTPQDRLLAVVCGYACHATTLDFYKWSGDYPGFFQLALEKAHPDAVALFWAGCGGDINPLPRRSVALAEQYGQELADSVEAVLKKPLTAIPADRGALATAYVEIDLPFAELPTREQIVKNAASSNRYEANRAKFLLRELEKNGSLPSTYPYPVQAWQLGPDLTWLALGGEVVVDYSLRLKKELGPGKTWVTAYANDVMAYIPSLRVLREGGYEGGGAMVYYGQPTVWSPKVEEKIVDAVHEMVRKVKQK